MKEIIPLKKDILFKTKIGEITNINLEHDYKIKDDIIEGNVFLSGSYKMTEASVLEEDFYYKIPFSIALTKKINKDTIKIEIDDFKYEVLKDILNVNINLELSCEEETKEEDKDDELIEEYFNNESENEIEIKEENIIGNETKVDIDTNINNITNTIINNDNKYYTYKIYIVRQGDTLEKICNKYNISKEELNEYNNINEINEGDKIIIPSFDE